MGAIAWENVTSGLRDRVNQLSGWSQSDWQHVHVPQTRVARILLGKEVATSQRIAILSRKADNWQLIPVSYKWRNTPLVACCPCSTVQHVGN